jgi:hypothetical protein
VNSSVVVNDENQMLGVMEKQDVSLAHRPPSIAAQGLFTGYQRENSPYLPLH